MPEPEAAAHDSEEKDEEEAVTPRPPRATIRLARVAPPTRHGQQAQVAASAVVVGLPI